MLINRLHAVAFVAILAFPASWLVDGPHERALQYARGLGDLLRETAEDDDRAGKVLPTYAAQLRQARDEATAIAANPALVEPAMRRYWLYQLAGVIAGAIGTVCLWWQPRFWRAGVLAGLAGFVAISNLYDAPRFLWMSRGSLEAVRNVLRLWTTTPSAIVIHFVAPFVLLSVGGYALLPRRHRTSDASK